MRFCLITTFFPPQHFGGDAVFVANLANLLAGAGHEVEVVHCSDSFELLKNDVQPSEIELNPNIKVHALHSALGPLSPVLTYATGQPWLKAKRLEEILARNFDVVHWHNLSLVGGPGALKLAKGVRLCTLHDYWFICPTHILFKFNQEACTERSCFRCTLAHHRLPQPWRAGGFLPRSLRNIDRFLAPSRFVQAQYEQSSLRIKSTVLPHFVPGARQLSINPISAEPYFLYVGRLEKAKGVQTILSLFRRPGRKLLIAGAGNYESELRKQAVDVPGVNFLGRVPHNELGGLYAGAIATIVPSICYETFGLTILESFRYATPVIASDFGALPELIDDTGGGTIYRNLNELEQLLERFEREPDLARRFGQHGAAALLNYSPEAHLQKYLAIVEDASMKDSRVNEYGDSTSFREPRYRGRRSS